MPRTTSPSKLLELILNKKANLLHVRGEKPSEYVLKVCGQDEYLVGDHQLIDFQYIQDSISRDVTPTLVTISVHNVPSKFAYYTYTCISFIGIF